MKTVSIFKSSYPLPDADASRLREELKRQYDEGLVVLDARLDYIGTLPLPEREKAAVILSPAREAGNVSAGAVRLSRRTSEAVSLAELKAAITSGRGPELIRPFDEFSFTLDTGEAVTAVCGGYIGDRRARFVFKDCLATEYKMNDTATNEGGYFKSKGRKTVLEEIYPHLPPELREVIEPRPLVETIDGETVEYSDPLWIPSGTDVFGPLEDWYDPEPDSEQLEIFKRERDRVKECGSRGTWPYALRSPYRSYSANFVNVNTHGTVNSHYANISLGFAPGFDM